MRNLIAFCIFILLCACSDDSRNASNQDSGIDNDIQDSSSTQSDSSTKDDSSSGIQDSSFPDSQKDSIGYQDADIEDSGLLDSDIVDSDLSDTESEDAQETEGEVITDEPTRIYVDNCELHYANNKRCPEEKCTVWETGYNYQKGCPGMEHAHIYLCTSANPPKDDFKYMLLCVCACADIE